MSTKAMVLGWEEWLALPDLGLPAVKAKVDTGARTSALHAFLIEPFGSASEPMVRFGVHPAPGRTDIEVYCAAPVVGRRDVVSSNGDREERYVIVTRVEIGERSWPIEITLTNRETMSYRMLLGRQALAPGVTVDPTASFLQTRLSYRLYTRRSRGAAKPRALRIALITDAPARPTARLIARAAARAGHSVDMLEPGSVEIRPGDPHAPLLSAGTALPQYDAVLCRVSIDTVAFAAAVVRQLAAAGAYAPNNADALCAAADPIGMRQQLAAAGLAIAPKTFAHGQGKPRRRTARSTPKGEAAIRCLFVDGRAVLAGIVDTRSSARAARLQAVQPHAAVVRLAERAVRVLGLGLAAVDIEPTDDGPRIVAVTAMPRLAEFQRNVQRAPAAALLKAIEAHARSIVHRPAPEHHDSPAEGRTSASVEESKP